MNGFEIPTKEEMMEKGSKRNRERERKKKASRRKKKMVKRRKLHKHSTFTLFHNSSSPFWILKDCDKNPFMNGFRKQKGERNREIEK